MITDSDANNENLENFHVETPTSTKRCNKRPLSPLVQNFVAEKRPSYTKKKDGIPMDWMRGRRLSGNYREFFAEVIDSYGEGTNFVACVFCDYICAKSTGHFGQMKSLCDQCCVPCFAQSELMSRWKISRHIRDSVVRREQREKFANLVKEVRCRGAITYDFGHNKRDFFVITAHVITDQGILCPFVISFVEWQSHIHGEKSKENVWNFLTHLLHKQGFNDEEISRIGRVTDEGTNVRGSGPFSLLCCCHLLATISKRSVKLYELEFYTDDDENFISNLDAGLKKVEEFVKKARRVSVIQDGCGSGLIEPVETRWLSKYLMTERFLEKIDDIKRVLRENLQFLGLRNDIVTLFRKLDTEERLNLTAYVEVHRPLQEIVTEFETVTKPTINLIVPRLARFELHLDQILQDFVTESAEATIAKTIKVALERKLNKSMNIDLIKAATFLDPFYLARIESICLRVQRWGTFDSFRDSSLKLFHLVGIITPNENGQHESEETDEFPRRMATPSIELELNAYVILSVSQTNYDVLNFWNGVGKAFPLLRQLALKILAIPAGTSHSERSFSKLRLLYNSYRQRLSPETISSIITLGSLDFDVFNDADEDD